MDDDETFNEAVKLLQEQMEKPEIEEWLAIREKAGEEIEAQTAVVMVDAVQILDPYGVCTTFPPELCCIGRVLFARSPKSDIWVCQYDLPEATRDAIERRKRLVGGDDLPF